MVGELAAGELMLGELIAGVATAFGGSGASGPFLIAGGGFFEDGDSAAGACLV
jgi:hypothetical protein